MKQRKAKKAIMAPSLRKDFFAASLKLEEPKLFSLVNFFDFFCIGHLNGSEYSYRGSHNKTMRLKINTFPVYVYTLNSKEL